MSEKNFKSDRILSYFKKEWLVLLIVTVSGLIYNIGLLAGPLFEGKMTGCLIDILNGNKQFADMLTLVLLYILITAAVQSSRYIKRFYVRRFANNVNKRMKEILYGSLVHKSRPQLHEESAGTILTKAILDVDDCVEGMRKFTTEIFDTGVALLAYACMLLFYDWKLALLCMIFPPVSYIMAEKMKFIIQTSGAKYKEQSGALSTATLDIASNAITYRVFGREQQRRDAYEESLTAYEKSAVKANIWNTSLTSVYRVISMAGVIFILYFGGRNVLGTGWSAWSIATFTTFVSCFTKLSVKSSSAAKLFNAVHKAQVSWKRIKPLMRMKNDDGDRKTYYAGELEVSNMGFSYPDGKVIFDGVSFTAAPGEIIGITGPVACGKSTLGKVFLGEYPYRGSIKFSGEEMKGVDSTKNGIVAYLGHDCELFDDTVRNNILMGDDGDVNYYLKMVCLDKEVALMENGVDTLIGSSGVRLSGGQAQRLALARTICHKKPVIILDDPFSALDKDTEKQIFKNLGEMVSDSIVMIISHRLYLFPQMNKVIWLNDGKTEPGSHDELIEKCSEYALLYNGQNGGGTGEK